MEYYHSFNYFWEIHNSYTDYSDTKYRGTKSNELCLEWTYQLCCDQPQTIHHLSLWSLCSYHWSRLHWQCNRPDTRVRCIKYGFKMATKFSDLCEKFQNISFIFCCKIFLSYLSLSVSCFCIFMITWLYLMEEFENVYIFMYLIIYSEWPIVRSQRYPNYAQERLDFMQNWGQFKNCKQ